MSSNFQASAWKAQGDDDQKEITSCSALHEAVKIVRLDVVTQWSQSFKALVEAQVPNDLFSFEARNVGRECKTFIDWFVLQSVFSA